jgi:hypothetical protein
MAALEEKGRTHRTICNNYTSIATFLKFCGVDHKELLPKGERPRPLETDPEAYTTEGFLAAVKRDRDRLAFEFLLKTHFWDLGVAGGNGYSHSSGLDGPFQYSADGKLPRKRARGLCARRDKSRVRY